MTIDQLKLLKKKKKKSMKLTVRNKVPPVLQTHQIPSRGFIEVVMTYSRLLQLVSQFLFQFMV